QVGIARGAVAPQVTVFGPITEGLRTPVRLAVGDGSLYVADPRGGGVLEYTPAGRLVRVIGTGGAPAGIGVGGDGSLLVSRGSYVSVLGRDGQEQRRLIPPEGPFKAATGIAVDDTGTIYVTDSGTNCVQVFSAGGAPLFKFGSFGIAQGIVSINDPAPAARFNMPTAIAFEKQSRQLAIADTLNGRIVFYAVAGLSATSQPVRVIGSLGAGPLRFTAPAGVAFDYDGAVLKRLYVVDTYQGNIQAIDPVATTIVNTKPVAGGFLSYIGGYGSGNGQLMVPSDLQFDPATGRLLAVNGYGNVTVYGIDGGIDPSGLPLPGISIDPVPAGITVSSLTLGGTMTAGASVSISVPSPATAGPVTYPSATSWAVSLDGLATGLTTINVAARNLAGSASQSVTVTRLLPAPQLDITRVAGYTAQSSQNIGGSVTAGASVTIGNDRNGTVSAPVDGSSWSGTVVLLPGTNTITVTASQPGSATATVVTAIILDNAAPVLSVSAIADGSYTSTPTQNISGTVSDPWLDNVTVNGQPVVLTGDRFSSAVTLSGGSNNIIVTATDLAGNVSLDRRTVYFDATLPVITVTAPADNAATSKETITISGTIDKAATVTVNGVAATTTDNSWQADVNLGAGLNTVLIAATDRYGNSSSLKRSITLDNEAPVIAISQPGQDLSTASPNLILAGSASDATSFTLTASVNGRPVPLTLTGGEFSLPLEFTAEGPYIVSITATDAAGNISSTGRNITYDITPPLLTVNPVSGYYPERLSGTVEADATVTTSDMNGTVGRVVTDGTIWSADLTGTSYDPATLRIIATDAAGNRSTQGLVVHEPDGDLNGDGLVTMADALMAIRIVSGGIVPTADNLLHGDIGPLLAGRPNPNGRIDLVDALLILRRAVGLSSW
ncbi:MAG: hypothetical protein CXR31_15775, partial [Geobacter sp.]